VSGACCLFFSSLVDSLVTYTLFLHFGLITHLGHSKATCFVMSLVTTLFSYFYLYVGLMSNT
jgi:hypothetical protein